MLTRFYLLVALQTCLWRCTAAAYDTAATREAEPDRLQVHLVPHSHDDAGWLKTVDQYYYGSRQDIQTAGVQYILDSVVAALIKCPDRRFSFAEISFFSRWWAEQDAETQAAVKSLVKEGRLTFVNGGYVQHDEATSHFVAMIDQTTLGHRFLKDKLDFVPTIGWQIDPFGHTSTQAGLLGASLGFDALFFGRADYQDMTKRKRELQLEVLWRGSGGGPSAPEADAGASLFTGNFASGNYGPPPGFWWEWVATPDAPMMDDPRLKDYNVEERVEKFVQGCLEQANVTKGVDIMMTMGSDFHYTNAHLWYKNLDKLIHYVNKDGRVHAFYSSPQDYVAAKHSYNTTWPLKRSDFFPYADTPHSYWTGYFSSRPTSKGYIRAATAYLQAARQLEAYVGVNPKGPNTAALEAAVALCQHHDSITGTARQHVVNDYHSRIHAGMLEAQQVVTVALGRLILRGGRQSLTKKENMALLPRLQAETTAQGAFLRPESASDGPDFRVPLQGCLWRNVSACGPTVDLSRLGASIFAVVYNPVAWSRVAPVRVPVSTQQQCLAWKVVGPNGENVQAQLVPAADSTLGLQRVLAEANATPPMAAGDAEVVFTADLPPLGFSTFELRPHKNCSGEQNQKGASSAPHSTVHALSLPTRETVSITNGIVTLTFDGDSGLLASMEVESGSAVDLMLDFGWYNASDGLETEEDYGQSSGAYIFRPNGETPLRQHAGGGGRGWRSLFGVKGLRGCRAAVAALEVVEGEELSEVRQIFDDWASLIIRLHRGQRHFEVEWTVGPIPYEDGLGKEVVLRYSSSLDSGDAFYTDANGRAMVRRQRNFRSSWDLNVTEPVAGNYYPVTAAAFVQDNDTQLAVLTDRAQGAASLRSGEMEFMVHRRTLVDDRRGVHEALNETVCGCRDCDCPGLIARGVHWVLLAPRASAAHARRSLQQLLNDPPVLAFGPVPQSLSSNAKNTNNAGYESSDGDSNGNGSLLGLRRSFSLTDDRILHSGVHLLTLMGLDHRQLLVRVAHLWDVDETASGNASAAAAAEQGFTEDLGALLAEFHCNERPVELTLSGNQLRIELHRLEFLPGRSIDVNKAAADSVSDADAAPSNASAVAGGSSGSWLVHLQPMEVRTFSVGCW